MVQQLREVMTARPVALQSGATVLDAARAMADGSIGSVLVVHTEDTLRGLIIDRDIVVRAVATGRELTSTTLGEVCTEDVATLSASDSVSDAIRLMSEQAIRRVPVMAGGKLVGVVSLGDIVLEQDPLDEQDVHFALADISAAPPDDPASEVGSDGGAASTTTAPPKSTRRSTLRRRRRVRFWPAMWSSDRHG